jgi:hypothetical protein
LISGVPNVSADCAKERVSLFDALNDGPIRISLGRVPIHLGSVEHAIAASEQ